MSRNPQLYLDDIVASIGKIERYARGISPVEFRRDDKTIDAVIRNLEIIGEAVKHLPADLKSAHPHIPWSKIIGMRNKVMHEYFGVDPTILWETIQADIPALKKLIAGVVDSRSR